MATVLVIFPRAENATLWFVWVLTDFVWGLWSATMRRTLSEDSDFWAEWKKEGCCKEGVVSLRYLGVVVAEWLSWGWLEGRVRR